MKTMSICGLVIMGIGLLSALLFGSGILVLAGGMMAVVFWFFDWDYKR
jgi:hypothetical protein